MIRLFRIFLTVIVLHFTAGCKNRPVNNSSTNVSIDVIGYKYIKSYLHDTTSFTEGLVIHDGKLYESTGSPKELPYTKSVVGVVNLETGKMDEKVLLNRNQFFGEGIAFLNGKLFQLTYKSKVGFVYDAATFKKLREFTIPGNEGWGLTTDGSSLIMSDGTYVLTYLNPENLEVIKTIHVTENGNAKNKLNELEYINGFVYANLWPTNTIVKINPEDGNVVGLIDLEGFSSEVNYLYQNSLEMNGIAYDSGTNKVYVTGKLWPKIYEIELIN